MSDKLIAYPRVTSEIIKPFEYTTLEHRLALGESLEVRATGTWGNDKMPVSLHIITMPGSMIAAPLGECLKITIERDDRTPEDQIFERGSGIFYQEEEPKHTGSDGFTFVANPTDAPNRTEP